MIRLVEESELSVRRTLREIKVSRTSFYRWYWAYEEIGLDGVENQSRAVRQHWNRIPDSVRELIVDVALERLRQVPEPDQQDQRVVADRFYLLPGGGLGLVLPVYGAG